MNATLLPRLLSLIVALCLALVAGWATTGSAAAQGEKRPEMRRPFAEDYQIPTEQNDEGATVWGEWAANCPNCKGAKKTVCFHCVGLTRNEQCLECNMTKEAPCRVCAGEGMIPSPLEKAPCGGCLGAGMFPCHLCGGEGNIRIVGGSEKGTKCMGCKGAGGYPCGTCRGERMVAPPKLKPDVATAELADLKEAREILEGVMSAMDEWKPKGGPEARKEIKNYAAMMKPAGRFFPATRGLQRDFQTMMKRLLQGSNFESFPEMSVRAMDHYRQTNQYYFKHQKHLLDQCIKRQEANANADGDGGDGKE